MRLDGGEAILIKGEGFSGYAAPWSGVLVLELPHTSLGPLCRRVSVSSTEVEK